jgi:hypothetical protein
MRFTPPFDPVFEKNRHEFVAIFYSSVKKYANETRLRFNRMKRLK